MKSNSSIIIAHNTYVFVTFAYYLSSLYEVEVLTTVGVNVTLFCTSIFRTEYFYTESGSSMFI